MTEAERLRAALADAIEEMEDMILYVPTYFRAKWDHDGAIERAKSSLNEKGENDV